MYLSPMYALYFIIDHLLLVLPLFVTKLLKCLSNHELLPLIEIECRTMHLGMLELVDDLDSDQSSQENAEHLERVIDHLASAKTDQIGNIEDRDEREGLENEEPDPDVLGPLGNGSLVDIQQFELVQLQVH